MKKLVFVVIALFVAIFSVGESASASSSHRLCAFKVVGSKTLYKTFSYTTFSTNSQGYRYAYDGSCDGRTICPAVYDPVCGKSWSNYKSFSNRCELSQTSYRLQYTGVCKTRADIQVTSVSIQKSSSISRGDSFTVKTTLKVSWLASGTSIDLRSYLSNEQWSKLETCAGANPKTRRNTISSGTETITHSCRFDYFRSVYPSGNRYSIESVADVSDRVRESNEHNNAKTTSLRIGSSNDNCNGSAYAPICGKRWSSEKTFRNTCELYKQSTYSYSYTGKCGDRNSSYNDYKFRNSNHNISFSPYYGTDSVNYNSNYNSNYTSSYYNKSYSYNYTRSCSNVSTRYVCGRDGNKFKSFKNNCYLDKNSKYSYAYTGRCSSSKNRYYKNNNNYYYNSYYSYGTSYKTKTCPVFKLSASVNGCSYEYIKNEDGCDIPKLVCGTKNTTVAGNLKIKTDKKLAEAYSKIDNAYLNKNSKIIALGNLKSRLEAELRKNSDNKSLLKYMIASIEEKIEEYEASDGVTPIFDILY